MKYCKYNFNSKLDDIIKKFEKFDLFETVNNDSINFTTDFYNNFLNTKNYFTLNNKYIKTDYINDVDDIKNLKNEFNNSVIQLKLKLRKKG